MRHGNPIQTYTGKMFLVLAPKAEDVDILDIAHSLSMQCRWGGHCNYFYSVAEHSVRVSRILPGENALWGLLHDAAEAYLIDLPSPIKQLLPAYQEAEYTVLKVIARVFGLELPLPQPVHDADMVLRVTEHRDLLGGPTPPWADRDQALSGRIHPWVQHEAKSRFMARYQELTR